MTKLILISFIFFFGYSQSFAATYEPSHIAGFTLTVSESESFTSRYHDLYKDKQFYRSRLGSSETVDLPLGTPFDEIDVKTAQSDPKIFELINAYNDLGWIERAAVSLYTSSDERSWGINKELWTNQSLDFSTVEWFVLPITSALNKLPKYFGVSYSGLSVKSGAPEEYVKKLFGSGIYELRGLMSTSTIAVSSYTQLRQVVLEIKGHSGVDISKFSNYSFEKEVLYPPGCKFKVLSVEKRDIYNLDQIVVKIMEIN